MDRTERHERQVRTFLRAVGVMRAEYPQGVPEGVYRDLKRRGRELGIDLESDLETPLPRAPRGPKGGASPLRARSLLIGALALLALPAAALAQGYPGRFEAWSVIERMQEQQERQQEQSQRAFERMQEQQERQQEQSQRDYYEQRRELERFQDQYGD
jgi:hypothetical protein